MNRALVPSLTREGSAWHVTETDGTVRCDCPPFTMGPTAGQPCKHIPIYLAAKEMLRRCHELHGADGEHVCGQCLVTLLGTSARKVKRRYTLKTLARRLTRSRRGAKT